jgi:hypothetical protein
LNRLTHARTAVGVASIRPRLTSPRAGVQGVERDLPAVHINPGYDRHQGLLRVPAFAATRTISRRAEGGPAVQPFMPSLREKQPAAEDRRLWHLPEAAAPLDS